MNLQTTVAELALRTAFDGAPELATVFEAHLPAGIAEGLRSKFVLRAENGRWQFSQALGSSDT